MIKVLIYKLIIFSMFTIPVIVMANSGAAYELQLNHSLKRWVDEMDYLYRNGKDVEVVYVCVQKTDAENLSKEFPINKKIVKSEKILGYTTKFVVLHTLPSNKKSYEQWLRRQFFIGIAYRCDMDGLMRLINKFNNNVAITKIKFKMINTYNKSHHLTQRPSSGLTNA